MTVELVIGHIGASGDGVAIKDGEPWYIPFTAPGDRVNATAVEKRGNGVLAEVDTLLEDGAERIAPACRHFGTCGGCALQHLAPAFTAAWKRQRIVDCLSMAGVEDAEVQQTVTSNPGGRRRVEFIAAKRKKGVMAGFHLRRSHQIFDVGECPLIDPELMALVKPLRATLPELLPRNSEARVMATVTENGLDLLITAKLDLDLAVRQRLGDFAQSQQLARISWRQTERGLAEVIAARKESKIRLGNAEAALPPGGFLQATEAGERALAEAATAALANARSIADLFAGIGTFTFPLAAFARVHAVEGDAELVNSLKMAANKAILPVTCETRDLFQRPLFPEELKAFDGLLFDPPRAGAKAQAEEIAKSNVPTVVAISCNPVSFSRDIAILIAGGYKLGPVLPVDQFLWSPHVEMVAALTRG
ncbi:MAG: hypothetical protein K9G33_15830 [Sneathiella sp.]|nr:hypothetical protein [Sneathiella sp.]